MSVCVPTTKYPCFKRTSFKSGQNTSDILECYFVFSLVWSVGCNTTASGRRSFNDFLLPILRGVAPESVPKEFVNKKLKIALPRDENVLIYDYYFSRTEAKYINYSIVFKLTLSFLS